MVHRQRRRCTTKQTAPEPDTEATCTTPIVANISIKHTATEANRAEVVASASFETHLPKRFPSVVFFGLTYLQDIYFLPKFTRLWPKILWILVKADPKPFRVKLMVNARQLANKQKLTFSRQNAIGTSTTIEGQHQLRPQAPTLLTTTS